MKTIAAAMTGAVLVLLGSSVNQGRTHSGPAPAATPVTASPFSPVPHDGGPKVADLSAEDLTGVVQQYCTGCHNDRRLRGNLSLETFKASDAVQEAPTAEKMIHKLRAGMMPPPGARRPSPDTLQAVAQYLETTIDAAAAKAPDPGRRTFQRLNRDEYARSVSDILHVDADVSAYLPSETISENFDNIADVQDLSASLLDGYLRAAAAISRMAVGDPNASASTTTYKVAKTQSQMVHIEGTPMGTRGGIGVTNNFLADGDYVFKVQLQPGPTGFLYGMATPSDGKIEVSIDGARVALLDVDRFLSESDPGGLKIETDPIHVTAGPHLVAAAFLKRFEDPGAVDDLIEPVDYTLADTQIGDAYGVTTLPHLRDVAITGPFNVTGVSDTPSRRAIFTCRPTSSDEARPCATSIISRIAKEAYRRPVTDDDMADLMNFFDQGAKDGGFEVGIRTAIQAILASPQFIFRVETPPSGVKPGQAYALSDLDLASRLSFFLWSLPPDDQLLDLAKQGKLHDSSVMDEQVQRMLDDPRSEALATRFASLWLHLQDLDKIHPDAQLFPYWDHSLSEAMKRETQLDFYDLVKHDGSLLKLLDADSSFVNERLAEHYGIRGVTGDEFQKVELPANRRGLGLLGQGSILTLTSHANRTSPTVRGKWIMEVLLGSPPPPPPPAVPALEQTAGAKNTRELTTRERMEMHRANPMCASCHNTIDPLGFALDNFDVTGGWRIKENGTPLDPTGELYDGTQLKGPKDLRDAILDRKTVFVRTFTKNLLAYALGRRAEYFDMPTVRSIERQAAKNDYDMRSFFLGVVNSPAFRMNKAETVAQDNDNQQ